MKKITIILILFLVNILGIQAQSIEIPEEVLKSFNQKVDNPMDVEWEFDSIDQEWEVEYKLGKEEFSTTFDINANWLETEREIKFSELPDLVKKSIDSLYKKYRIDEVEQVDTPQGMLYEVEFEITAKGKLKETLEVYFSPDGKVVKEEKEVEEDLKEKK